MFSAYAQHGNYQKVLSFFKDMKQDHLSWSVIGMHPCWDVKDNLKWFDLIVSKYNLTPQSEHYVRIVDILNRAGELEKELSYIREMPDKAGYAICVSLLEACKTYAIVNLGELVANNLLKLDSQSSE
jgi:pentatricopeptide repeat protein